MIRFWYTDLTVKVNYMHPLTEQDSQHICNGVAKYSCSKLHRLLLKLSYPIWHPFIWHIFARAHEKGVIDSSRFHVLSALTDRTQDSNKAW
jgi:hypothetical protein